MLDLVRRFTVPRRLSKLLAAHAARGTMSGAVLVRHRGRTLLRAATGFASRDAGELNRPETRFRIGSIGKTFTALAVLRLIDRGRLTLDTPIGTPVPETGRFGSVTVHHLLSNTSGIPDFLTRPALQPRIGAPHRLLEVLALVDDEAPLFAPGARLSYSNTNWTLLALTVERLVGTPFPRALDELVLEPLELRSTGVDRGDEPNAAMGATLTADGPAPATEIHPTVELGAGGIRSTVDDLARLDRALVAPGFLHPDTLTRMATPVAETGGLGYGYGLFSTRRFDRLVIGHTGGTFGFTAFWSRYPADDLVTIVLANLDNGSAEALERDLGAATLGLPYELPSDRVFVTVDRAALSRCEGRYRSSFAGRAIDFAVEREDDRLFAAFPLLPRTELRPLSPTRFFTRLKGGDVVFDFVGEPGPAPRIAVDWSGHVMECPRIG